MPEATAEHSKTHDSIQRVIILGCFSFFMDKKFCSNILNPFPHFQVVAQLGYK